MTSLLNSISPTIIIVGVTMIIMYYLLNSTNTTCSKMEHDATENQKTVEIKIDLDKEPNEQVILSPLPEAEDEIYQLEGDGVVIVKQRNTPTSKSVSVTGKNIKTDGNFKLKISGNQSNVV